MGQPSLLQVLSYWVVEVRGLDILGVIQCVSIFQKPTDGTLFSLTYHDNNILRKSNKFNKIDMTTP